MAYLTMIQIMRIYSGSVLFYMLRTHKVTIKDDFLMRSEKRQEELHTLVSIPLKVIYNKKSKGYPVYE